MGVSRKCTISAAFVATTATATGAAGFSGLDPLYASPMFNFEGFYAGGSIGAGFFPGSNPVGTVGIVAGTNIALTDAIFAGLEFQGDGNWNGKSFQSVNGLLLGRVGSYLGNATVFYGTAGGGWVGGDPAYGIGVGIEQALNAAISIRGEGMATGSWGGWPEGAKTAVSVLWHLH